MWFKARLVVRDKKGIFAAVITNLSKAFDCIPHNLLIAKLEFLEPTVNNIFAWFKHNGLATNSGKSHFLVSGYEKISFKILDSTFESSTCEELLRITIDSELTFHENIM